MESGSKEFDMPSGAKLAITVSPFAVSRSLYQAILEELKLTKLNPSDEIDINLFKDLMCIGFSSKKIEACIWECMKRVTYNGVKVTLETFEPLEAREDYFAACIEVIKENAMPFMKSLYAQLTPLFGSLKKPSVPA